jgi:hypothetical protein
MHQLPLGLIPSLIHKHLTGFAVHSVVKSIHLSRSIDQCWYHLVPATQFELRISSFANLKFKPLAWFEELTMNLFGLKVHLLWQYDH